MPPKRGGRGGGGRGMGGGKDQEQHEPAGRELESGGRYDCGRGRGLPPSYRQPCQQEDYVPPQQVHSYPTEFIASAEATAFGAGREEAVQGIPPSSWKNLGMKERGRGKGDLQLHEFVKDVYEGNGDHDGGMPPGPTLVCKQPYNHEEYVPRQQGYSSPPQFKIGAEAVLRAGKQEEAPGARAEEVAPGSRAQEVAPVSRAKEVVPGSKAEAAAPRARAKAGVLRAREEEEAPRARAEKVTPESRAEQVAPGSRAEIEALIPKSLAGKAAFRSTEERVKYNQRELENLNNASGKTVNELDLRLELQPMLLHGRVIEPPVLAYNRSSTIFSCRPDLTGKWYMDGKRFLKSRERCSWVMLNFTTVNMGDLQKFASALVSSANVVGMDLEKVADIRSFGPTETVSQAIKYAKDCGVTFAVVVLSERDNVHSYEEIKFVADIQYQLPTQCIKGIYIRRQTVMNSQFTINVLLKINSKLGGVNHALLQRPLFFTRPTVVLGADTAHSPTSFACPSIAALVGSLDASLSQYAVTCRVQKNPNEKKLSQEIILELKEMTVQILQEFEKARGKYPERIIVFRRGVSEGQFRKLLGSEIAMIKKACSDILAGNTPPMTYIVVQTGHRTRFRPQNPRDGIGVMGNIPAGTTVDTGATNPTFLDFLISSHETTQGTSKPTRYTVIFDENNFSSDELQKLCYHLCFLYARCNQSISSPSPARYADLACKRARKYADFLLSQDAESTVNSGSDRKDIPDHVKNTINNLMAKFDVGMFYV